MRGVVPLLLLSGCGTLLGLDAYETGGEGAAGSGVGGVAGMAPAAEDCSNGRDDDGDGQLDCADDDCTGAGARCVGLPAEWQGPIAFGVDRAAVCSSQTALQGSLDASAEPAICGSCSCDFDPQSCNLTVEWHAGDVCAAAQTVTSTGCSNQITAAHRSARVSARGATGCSASLASMELPPVDLGDEPREGCPMPAGAGCDGNEVCTLPPEPGFSGPCVYRIGEHACPSGFEDATALSILDDSRGCACECGASPSDCGQAMVQGYGASNCGGTPVIVGNQNVCISSIELVSVGVSAGCTPKRQGPVGTAFQTVTVCCAPM